MSDEMPVPTRAHNYLRTLKQLRERRLEIDQQMVNLVIAARVEHVTWHELGDALGTSSQAAWEKYRPKDPPKILPGQGAWSVNYEDE